MFTTEWYNYVYMHCIAKLCGKKLSLDLGKYMYMYMYVTFFSAWSCYSVVGVLVTDIDYRATCAT